MAFDPRSLKPHIKEILTTAEVSDISTRTVRDALAAKFPGINIAFYKDAINVVIQEVFDNLDDEMADVEEEDDEDIKPLIKDVKPKLPKIKKIASSQSFFTSSAPHSSHGTSSGFGALSRSENMRVNMNMALGNISREGAEFIEEAAIKLANEMFDEKVKEWEEWKKAERIREGKSEKRAQNAAKKAKNQPEEEDKSKKSNQTGMNKLWNISPALSAVCGGATQLTRFEVPGLIWKYIKLHGLQHPEDGRIITPDATLMKVLPKREINMMQLAKHYNTHLLTPAV